MLHSRARTLCNRRHSKQLLARISVGRVCAFFGRFSIGSRFLLHSSAFNFCNSPDLMRRVIGELAHSCVIHFTWIFWSIFARTPIRLIQCNGMEWMRNHNHKLLIIPLVIRRHRLQHTSFHATKLPHIRILHASAH